MPFPYNKLTEEDIEYIKSVTARSALPSEKRFRKNIITMKCRNTAFIRRIFMWRS